MNQIESRVLKENGEWAHLVSMGDLYTGLKDKHGAKIYENDILKINDRISVVKHTNSDKRKGRSTPGFYEQVITGLWSGGSDVSWSDREIVGNIYQNPELLERQSE